MTDEPVTATAATYPGAASIAEAGAAEWAANQVQAEAHARGDLDDRTVLALAAFLRRVADGTARPHR